MQKTLHGGVYIADVKLDHVAFRFSKVDRSLIGWQNG